MKTISIIVAIYNVEDYLDKCLKSIKDQTYGDFVCYCVNDGSTDNSKQIVNKYLNDSRFVLLDKENGGVSDARNYGLEHVNTEYLMFVDGDDYLDINLLSECMNSISNSDVDILMFGYNQIHLSTNTTEQISLQIEDGVFTLKEKKELLAFTPNAVWNKIYKRSLFIDENNNMLKFAKGYRHQDLGITAKLLHKASSIQILNKPLYYYIIDRPDNITSKVDDKVYHVIDMSKDIIDYYIKEAIFNEYIEELEYLVKSNCIQSLRKVISSKNNEFVNGFINDVFSFTNAYFKQAKHSYYKYFDKHDRVYLSKFLTKLYYIFNKKI